MSKNFSLIKRKYFIACIVASAVLGACCGIIASCLLAVIFKTTGVNFHWALYIPIALAVCAGTGALWFFLLRPTDEKIAKRLDNDFALMEKTQTMVEFREATGAMEELQREQADGVLAEVSKKRADWSFMLKFLAIPVLAAALFFAGIFVPAKKSTQPEDPPFNITDSQKTALMNLINDVKASSLKVNLKDPTVEVLNGLLKGLEDEQPTNVMRTAVISSVKIIDGFFAKANTYGKISSVFTEHEELKTLAYALMNSATFYLQTGRTIRSFSQVTSNAENADQNIERILVNFATAFSAEFATVEDENTLPIPIEQASAKLTAYAEFMNASLEASGCAPKEGETADGLYAALVKFASSLENCASATGGLTANAYYETIKGVLADFSSVEGDAVHELSTQSYNCMMNEFIRNRLAEIFKLSTGDFGSSDAIVTTPDEGRDPGEDGFHGGGWGGGGLDIASNDLVLDTDYDDGRQTEYGKVINRYEQFFNEMADAGYCSGELEEYIRKYFELLYKGVKD